jgi:adenylosuccinate synthase
MQRVHVVAGAQYGSEGKGHVTAQLVQQALNAGDTHVINVRVAGPNAGHTVISPDGDSFALRTIPVGAALSDDMTCYIAPGSEVDPEVLFSELDLLRSKGHHVSRLFISGEATILTADHKQREATEGLTAKLGSTGKGIGAARSDRIMRTALRVKDDLDLEDQLASYGVTIREPEDLYSNDSITEDQTIVVEGTQGYGLGLHAGFYPKCTSSDTRAVDFLAMAGISPWRQGTTIQVWLAARVYPIRVAGNSGPMKGERSWEELGLPEEYTTVTHKVRRVGDWDSELVAEAVQANGGRSAYLAVTMADRLFPGLQKTTTLTEVQVSLSPEKWEEFQQWVKDIELSAGAEIRMLTTSPSTCIMIDSKL